MRACFDEPFRCSRISLSPLEIQPSATAAAPLGSSHLSFRRSRRRLARVLLVAIPRRTPLSRWPDDDHEPSHLALYMSTPQLAVWVHTVSWCKTVRCFEFQFFCLAGNKPFAARCSCNEADRSTIWPECGVSLSPQSIPRGYTYAGSSAGRLRCVPLSLHLDISTSPSIYRRKHPSSLLFVCLTFGLGDAFQTQLNHAQVWHLISFLVNNVTCPNHFARCLLHCPAHKRRTPLTAIRGCRCPSAVPSASADLRTSFPSVPPLSHELTFPASHQTTIQRHGRCRRRCSVKLVADVGPRRTRGSTHHSCSPAIRPFAHSVACESLHSGLSHSVDRQVQ